MKFEYFLGLIGNREGCFYVSIMVSKIMFLYEIGFDEMEMEI